GSVYHVSDLISNKVYSFKVEAGHASGLWSTDGPSVIVTTQPQPDKPPSVLFTGPESVKSGIPFDLTYGLSSVTQSIYAQDLTFTYDPEQLNFIGAEALREGISVGVDSQSPGRVHIIASSQRAGHAIREDGNLLALRWNAKSLIQPAIAIVTITDVVVSNSEGIETRISGASHSVRISTVEGDINGDIKITIGDLAIVAAAYSRTSTDPEWVKYVRADVNHDGKIDFEDLAMIARLIA
ncbi:cohesin domain-containing protein, partial [Paenibacillus sp. TAF58]